MIYRLIHADVLDGLRELADESIDSVVTDPPYGLGFMGVKWDTFANEKRENVARGFGGNHNPVNSADSARTRRVEGARFQAWCETWARECLRVLKPGGHLVAFGGTRTYHRMACAVEDAGFEIRDQLQYLYGSGFPKSRNLDGDWKGWGTALKPANEPIVLARKPLIGTVAANVQTHGTGALNIDGCRIAGVKDVPASLSNAGGLGWRTGGDMDRKAVQNGRWPANVILDEGAAEILDEQTGHLHPAGYVAPSAIPAGKYGSVAYGDGIRNGRTPFDYKDGGGGASRFFYTAKASTSERNEGLHNKTNHHPTVKPVAVMRWLVRLVTPPGGTVLDTFVGSGSTGMAAIAEGFDFIGIDSDAEHIATSRGRIASVAPMFATEEPRPTEIATA